MPYIRKSADQTYNHSANYGNTGELNRIKELERENQRLSDENSRLHDEAANLKIRMEQQKTRQAVRKNICFCYCEWARRGACLGKGLSSAMARYGAVCSDNSCEKSFLSKYEMVLFIKSGTPYLWSHYRKIWQSATNMYVRVEF